MQLKQNEPHPGPYLFYRNGKLRKRLTPITNQPIWQSLLGSLYGDEVAARTGLEVTALLYRHQGRRLPAPARWDHTDAWLITYPDQFQRPGESNLETLRRFHEAYLADTLTGVHVLPFFPWSSDDGFSIVDYLEVDERYGTWDDITSLADETRLMVDAVANHLSAQGNWFTKWLDGEPGFEGLFRTEDPAADMTQVVRAREHPLLTRFETASGPQWVWTTFSPDQVDLDYRDPHTLLRILEVLLEYASRGAGMIRLDAVGFLWKELSSPSIHLDKTHEIVRFLRACLDETYPNVMLVTETNVPHAENVSYFGDDGVNEAQAVYQFPLPPLVLHAFKTGDPATLRSWVDSMAPPPPGTTFLNMLATHDGVGLRPLEGLLSEADLEPLLKATTESGGQVSMREAGPGVSSPYELNATWFDLIREGSTPDDAIARHLASHAVMFALQGVPAIYVHSLFGTRNDTEAVRTSGEARRINRRKFTDVATLETELADRSSITSRVFRGMTEMLRWRRSSIAFHPSAPQHLLPAPRGVIGIGRGDEGEATAEVYINTGSRRVTLDIVADSEVQGWRWSSSGSSLELGPWGAVWLT